MIDTIVILLILVGAGYLLWRQFRRGCACDTDDGGSSCCGD